MCQADVVLDKLPLWVGHRGRYDRVGSSAGGGGKCGGADWVWGSIVGSGQ